jgi:hypothetical protein
MGGPNKNNSGNPGSPKTRKTSTARRSTIVTIALRIIAGSEKGRVSRAAEIIGVSEPTVYRWERTGSMRNARGVDILRVHELTGLPLEMLLRG